MSSLSRKYARASARDKKLMQQYQPEGEYQWAEEQYNSKKAAKKKTKELADEK